MAQVLGDGLSRVRVQRLGRLVQFKEAPGDGADPSLARREGGIRNPAGAWTQEVSTTMAAALTDAVLIDRLQGGFPIVDRPFAEWAPALGLREDELIERLRQLFAIGMLSHFGPQFRIERAGGRFALAAASVPKERFDDVAGRVDAHREVAYNDRRDHAPNMRFIVAVERAAEVAAVIDRIASQIGLPVLELPQEREHLPRRRRRRRPIRRPDDRRPSRRPRCNENGDLAPRRHAAPPHHTPREA